MNVAILLHNTNNPYMEHLGIDVLPSASGHPSGLHLQVTKERVHRAINVAVATVTLLLLGTVVGQPSRPKPWERPQPQGVAVPL